MNKMEQVYIHKTKTIKKKKQELEKRLNVHIDINRGQVSFEGSPVDEYGAALVFEAIAFGFSIQKALLLLEEDYQFRKIHIRDYTRRKNLRDVLARIVGTKGKTRRTVETISGCFLIIHDHDVGIIGESESIENAVTAITRIIKGSKQANMYKYLERMNRIRNKNYI